MNLHELSAVMCESPGDDFPDGSKGYGGSDEAFFEKPAIVQENGFHVVFIDIVYGGTYRIRIAAGLVSADRKEVAEQADL